MAEERIVDDDLNRGIKLKKTEEGFIDATDALADDGEALEEISFAYPIEEADEDDEDLVGLSPEEAAALRKRKIEEAERRLAEYAQTVAEGNELLATKSFRAAELKFEKALKMDALATEASVGYWRAKTADFTDPDVLIEEYVEPGIESLEYDLGYEATEIIKRDYRSAFEKRYQELKAVEEPLFLEVNGKQERRRVILKERRKRAAVAFGISAAAMLVCVILAIVFGLKNFSTPDNTYIPVTIVLSAVAVVAFFVFILFSNKLINACRMFAANERLTSTEEGEELFQIQERMNLYGELLNMHYEEEDEEISETEDEE